MAVKDFFAPTRGRILVFVMIFLLVFIYDTMFAPFPGSPVVDNLDTQDGATSFLLYILVLPYVLSSLLPAFMGLRKRRFFRISTLTEFMHPRPEHHAQKPSKQQTFVFPAGTPTESSSMTPQATDSLDSVEESQQHESSTPKPLARKKAASTLKGARKPAKRSVKKAARKRPRKK